jgi:hypothetical protein
LWGFEADLPACIPVRPASIMAKASKCLAQCKGLLSEVGLSAEGDNATPASVAKVVRTLLASVDPGHAELTEGQIDNWARCISDLTLDRSLAVEALRLGVLPALPRFLDRYKNKHQPVSGDVGWSDALIALHNFALLEDAGFPDALAKLAPIDLRAIAFNLARALKPGLYPSGGGRDRPCPSVSMPQPPAHPWAPGCMLGCMHAPCMPAHSLHVRCSCRACPRALVARPHACRRLPPPCRCRRTHAPVPSLLPCVPQTRATRPRASPSTRT